MEAAKAPWLLAPRELGDADELVAVAWSELEVYCGQGWSQVPRLWPPLTRRSVGPVVRRGGLREVVLSECVTLFCKKYDCSQDYSTQTGQPAMCQWAQKLFLRP